MMTALGRLNLRRTYFACTARGQGGTHADPLLGLDGFLTRQATRLICLTGGRLGFAATTGMLAACCGWTVSDETVRLACEGQAGRLGGFQATGVVRMRGRRGTSREARPSGGPNDSTVDRRPGGLDPVRRHGHRLCG